MGNISFDFDECSYSPERNFAATTGEIYENRAECLALQGGESITKYSVNKLYSFLYCKKNENLAS